MRCLRLFACLAGLVAAAPAWAAVNGAITGRVIDEATGKPVAGVTVTVSGPALQGEQTEFSDAAGHYLITELPPGEYVVRFYFANLVRERGGIRLSADTTLPVNAAVPIGQAEVKTYRVVERAPNVDIGNAQVQTQVTEELVRNTPVSGRTYGSVLTLAPGSAPDTQNSANFSFGGATGAENHFLLDGMNTTNLSHGLLGTPLSLEFIKETEIITGGYNAEYGRATGGIVNVVTKSGSNQFHGGAWFTYNPFQLDGERVARLGEAVARQSRLDHSFDFGFDLGGPILKDRIWFYAGFAPQFRTDVHDRILRTRTAEAAAATTATGSYAGDIDSSLPCPSYLASRALCPAADSANGPFRTSDLGAEFRRRYASQSRLYNWVTKLSFRLSPNHHLTVSYIGAPSTFEGAIQNPQNPNPQMVGNGFNGSDAGIGYNETILVHDLSLHLVSKLLGRKLQIDLGGGYHFEATSRQPGRSGDVVQNVDYRESSLGRFEPEVAPCQIRTLPGGATFSPCPVLGYADGGLGMASRLVGQRAGAQLGVTYFAKLAGLHAFKLGGDFEYNQFAVARHFSGRGPNGWVNTLSDGTVERMAFFTQTDGDTLAILPGGVSTQTTTWNESLYLRDSYTVGFLPGLTVNAGLRWELQQLKDVYGRTQIDLTDNLAPRLGFVYDWTRTGRAKVYASYGRFYESIPLGLNDRNLSGLGVLIQDLPPQNGNPDPSCKPDANGRIDAAACQFPTPTTGNAFVNGGSISQISPSLKGQYSNELVAGLQYDIGWDLVLGAAYVHRDLGRIIEDISPDGGAHFIIANPGEPVDPAVLANLQSQIAKATDPAHKAELQQQLSLYQGVAAFPKPKRDYNALVLTAHKRLSRHFLMLASYTFSRTLGNYPGLYQASNLQLDPNVSTQYDLRELLTNRDGPLPNDRPHNFKLTGAYEIPIRSGALVFGLTFSALSGRPIEVLGRHPLAGSNETFILPRGSGGRTPTLTQLDLHVAYRREFSPNLRVDLTWDTFNVLNQREVTEVDDTYSFDNLRPIQNGTADDLANLKNALGQKPQLNPNYGRPVAYQMPLAMRFGLRISF